MSGSNDQKVRVSTDRLGEVNNNNEGVFERSNNGLDIKKSLVKMSNREGSTRSLSCFKNPEMSSKELPLSEEMTLDMYHTNFESNTGLKKKSKTFSSKSTDEKIQLSRLVKAKSEADGNFLNGKPMNGHCDTSPESSAIENLKSTMLESNEKNRNNQFRAATENFKAKLEENANKNPELKRADAVDNETKVDSMVKLSNLMKHREKVAGISVQENSEKIKEVPNQQKHGGQQVKQKVSNNVKQKTSESEENRRGHYDLRSQSKTSTKIHLVGPDSSQFLSNSRDEAGFDQKSVIKMKEQFDAVGVVKELKTKHVSNSTESSPKPKQALEMNKSPPVYEQWSENVEVCLCPKDEQTGESESKVSVGVNYSQGIRQISPQNEAQRIKVKSYQNESKHAAIDSNFKTSDSLLMNDNLSPDEFVVAEKIHKYNNDPSLKGKVSERKEFFSSLGRRLDSEFVARDWHASDRTPKPKHFEYFEDIERDRSHRNLRGRTEANRRKLDREDMPEDREIEDSKRSLKHLYAVHSERSGKQNHSYQKNHSFGNLNENGEHDYLQPNEHLYQNDKDWNVGHRFKDISGNVKTTGEENYIQKSRFTTRNLNGFNGDLSPVSDAPSDDKDSVGEYELQPKFGRSEIQVPSESAIQKMIEDDNRNDYILQKSTKTPVGTSKSNSKMTSDFDNHKPNGYGFYEKINETSDDTADKGKQTFVKKPRGNGLNYGQIWYEEEDKKHSDWAPTPPPVRTESGDEYNDNDSADYANDDELNDDDETTIRTITKTITRQIKQTIPSGIVTIAQEGGKRKTENHRITGTITAKKNKPRQTLEKSLVSGFINVEKEISHQPIRTPSRKEHNIEVVTKNNPTPPPRESISLSMFDARNATPLPSQAFLRHEGLTENYSERIMTTPLVETELGIDPELKDAKKTGSTYKITMNLTPSLLVSSRPASAVPNTNFISPPFSPSSFISQPNLISRHNSNISSDAHNTHYMNGTLSSVTPSVFSPPAQNAPFFHSNLSIHREQDRGSGSGTVVVSLTEASGNKKQVPTQSDVAFDISLQGIEGEPRPKNVSSLTVSNVKSSPRNEFSGRNIEEQVVKKDIMSSTLNDVPDNSRSNWKQTERNHLQRSAVALHGYSSRKLISAKPQEERNEVQFSKSGPREVSGDGGRSESRPEILYSALDATRAEDSQDAGRSVYDVGTISSKEQSRASQKIPECVVTNETPKWKPYLDYSRRNGEMTDMTETTGDHALTISYKNSLQSLDEDGQFDKEIEINKRHQSAFGTANVESYDTRRHASGGSSETWYGRRMEQINKFDLQTLLRGAAADSVKQRINIKRLGDKLSNGPQISPDLKHLLVRDELPPSENDKVAEEISMNIDNGKVTMTSEILCEKTVPIYNSQDMYKTSSVLLIRIIEVDLSVTPERKRLYDLIVGPNIEKRSLPENEKRELYKKFMALAEHSRKELM